MITTQTPGVYRQDQFPAPSPMLRTGVPVFLGLIHQTDLDRHPEFSRDEALDEAVWGVRAARATAQNVSGGDACLHHFTLWPEFVRVFEPLFSYGYLAAAVRGFFENDGPLCYILLVAYGESASMVTATRAALQRIATFDEIDLVCAPDLMWTADLQQAPYVVDIQAAQDALLNHCDQLGNRFAILDAWPMTGTTLNASVESVLTQRVQLNGQNGALYFPWVQPQAALAQARFVPPCGHIAGVMARTDREAGVHKAPANAAVQGVLDVQVNLGNAQQDRLNPQGVNCLRAFAGRGIRVWGARTLSSTPAWRYINVRRLFLTVGRWLERVMTALAFEPNEIRLWARVERELTAYFVRLFQQGALRGRTPQEAFYIKCDAGTNPAEVRVAGLVVAEVGLAPATPNEFVVVRIVHGTSGISSINIDGPVRPE